jgi:Ca-activated chloride channel homolog
MIRFTITLMLCLISIEGFSWNWKDLWITRDQQGAKYLKKQQYKEAEQTFENPEWQATAAYRAQNFEAASRQFGALGTADGYYNQGNAKAQLGQYQEALDAYQNSLKIRPDDPDTLYNKKMIEDLLKKQQQQQQDQQPKEQQEQNSNQQESSSEKNNKNKQEQEQEQNQEKNRSPNQPAANDQESESSHANDEKKESDSGKNDHPEEKEDQQQEAPASKNIPEPSNNTDAKNYQENEQWLNMIADDPGGLLRQKFLRDHRRRSHGENS